MCHRVDVVAACLEGDRVGCGFYASHSLFLLPFAMEQKQRMGSVTYIVDELLYLHA